MHSTRPWKRWATSPTCGPRSGQVIPARWLAWPPSILDKPGPLTSAEMERMRLRSYWTERVLARPPALARIGAIASLASERLDGSGYHRGLSGAAIPASGRILAAADACRAITEPRPHRPALSLKAAASELRKEVRSGRLAADAVDAVLAAAGRP